MMAEIEEKEKRKHNTPIFAHRLDAGRQLGEELRLRGYGDKPAVVIAIPRGGVPVGHAVSQIIDARLEIIIPRKLPTPGNPEVGFGAITSDGTMVLNMPQIEEQQLGVDDIKRVAMETLGEVRRQMRTFCGHCFSLNLTGQTIILVDDGLASGFTMLAAVQAIRRHRPARLIVAVPASTFTSIDRLKSQVDELIYLSEWDDLSFTVADCYQEFDTLTDDEVRSFLSDTQIQEPQ